MISNEINEIFDQYIIKARKEKNRNRKILHISLIILTVAVIFSLFGFARITSDSMEPTYTEGQFIIFTKLNNEYEKNDIVIIDYNGQKILRRIVGVSGDLVDIDNNLGELSINGIAEESNQLTVTDPVGIKFPIYITKDQVFVLCDKRNNTSDSRRIGCINVEDIIGKVIFSI